MLSIGIFLNSEINWSIYRKAFSKYEVGKNCLPSLLISTDRQPPIKPQYELKFNVGYDQNNVYFQQSGGTQPIINTVNEEVANSMIVGKKYMLIIEPIEE